MMTSKLLKALEATVLLLVLTLAPLSAFGQGHGKGRGRNTNPGTRRGPVNTNVQRNENENENENENRNINGNMNGNMNGNVNGNTHVSRRNRHPRTPRRVHRGRNTTPGTPRGPINSNR